MAREIPRCFSARSCPKTPTPSRRPLAIAREKLWIVQDTDMTGRTAQATRSAPSICPSMRWRSSPPISPHEIPMAPRRNAGRAATAKSNMDVSFRRGKRRKHACRLVLPRWGDEATRQRSFILHYARHTDEQLKSRCALFHGHRFRQVTRLIHVQALCTR